MRLPGCLGFARNARAHGGLNGGGIQRDTATVPCARQVLGNPIGVVTQGIMEMAHWPHVSIGHNKATGEVFWGLKAGPWRAYP